MEGEQWLIAPLGPWHRRPKKLTRCTTCIGQGGLERQTAPQIVYPEPTCPHPGCSEPMQVVDFQLEDHGRSVHDFLASAPLVE